MAFYTDNSEQEFYQHGNNIEFYFTNDHSTGPDPNGGGGGGATAQEIVDALLGVDILAYAGSSETFGAYFRDRLLTVNKFLGLQHMPNLPTVAESALINPFGVIDDAGNQVVDASGNRVVYKQYNFIVDNLGNTVIDDSGNRVIE